MQRLKGAAYAPAGERHARGPCPARPAAHSARHTAIQPARTGGGGARGRGCRSASNPRSGAAAMDGPRARACWGARRGVVGRPALRPRDASGDADQARGAPPDRGGLGRAQRARAARRARGGAPAAAAHAL
jgi:hypothetical protein